MGFFGALSKIIQGKPVFEVNQNQPQQSAPASVTPGQPVPTAPAPAGPKVYPQLYIGRVECRMSGDDMDVDIFIKNASQVQLDLDRISILGTSRDLGTFLRPGEEREFRVYSGDRPRNASHNHVEIDVKTDPGGDYFKAEFTMDFKQEADGTYTVQRFRAIEVRDV
jgi:hypothetical protein